MEKRSSEEAPGQMSYERMLPLLNDLFVLEGDSCTGVKVVLVEVKKTIRKAPALHSWQRPKTEPESGSGERQPFNLVFRFPVEFEATQGMYFMMHPVEGAFEGVFITPIARDDDGLYFEAIFN